MRLLLFIFLSLLGPIARSQNNIFRGQMSYEDGSPMGYGRLIFPSIRDSIDIDSTGKFFVNTSLPGHKVFYISNGDVPSKVFRVRNNEILDTLYKITIPDFNFYSYYRRNMKCPICLKSQSLVPVAYGLPTKKLFKKAKSGQVILMGCILPQYPVEYYCRTDQFYF